jgi:hypothetical protein
MTWKLGNKGTEQSTEQLLYIRCRGSLLKHVREYRQLAADEQGKRIPTAEAQNADETLLTFGR